MIKLVDDIYLTATSKSLSNFVNKSGGMFGVMKMGMEMMCADFMPYT